MTLSPGERFGAYEIGDRLGSGAMGEVFRARDLRLGRDVALKLLPERFRDDPERRRRFEAEALALSKLNHPNVVTVYGAETHGDVACIAMELIEGRTLRSLLSDGPLPPKKALDIAAQAGAGLAAAHERGLVHRDVKPENLVIGPVGDMSPEQAEGREADFRSDQFSLGSVLHEMLSGRAPFRRDTPGSTLAAILRDDPPPLPPLPAASAARSPGRSSRSRGSSSWRTAGLFSSTRSASFPPAFRRSSSASWRRGNSIASAERGRGRPTSGSSRRRTGT